MPTFDALLDPVVKLAAEAAQAILSIYAADFTVSDKDDTSPLTEADLAAHHVLVNGLSALTPEWPILSEEGGRPDFAERSRWGRYWLIDPLDGTKEFIKRNGEFTVNVALIDDHRPVLGVVHVPATGVYYAASVGRGAFKAEAAGGAVHAITVRPCPVDQRVVAVASRSHQSPEVAAYLERLGPCDLTSMGSSLKICLVAEGKADIYPRLGPTSEWDTAAAQAVLEVAGGQLTDLAGAPMRYNTKADILNPYFLAFGDAGRDWGAYLPRTD
ncbi:MAG: 3'(2'),5'-bisphosphate nucleotidase CysQ [Candidatus Macondimonas sp.]